ncbi:hypothetical protein OGCDGJMD_00257 [Cyanobium usitatum str. Tous]|nr:hypothetical protein OGCDGJMD_00257 [Cyanobium usitatum str. Tous]
MAAGAKARKAAALLGVRLTTLQRWRRQFAVDGDDLDGRKDSYRCNEHEFAALPPGQIVPVLADRGGCVGVERSF